MKERPIMFSSPMVKAILAGTKTQTRRIVTPKPAWREADGLTSAGWAWERRAHLGVKFNAWHDGAAFARVLVPHCPYGVPGERLWVRETFSHGAVFNADVDYATRLRFRANEHDSPLPDGQKWRPAIFMRRALSRLTLEVTAVRAQRLQEISEEDARAEGVEPRYEEGRRIVWADHVFRELWESINGKRAPLATNPWVWAITFKRVA